MGVAVHLRPGGDDSPVEVTKIRGWLSPVVWVGRVVDDMMGAFVSVELQGDLGLSTLGPLEGDRDTRQSRRNPRFSF